MTLPTGGEVSRPEGLEAWAGWERVGNVHDTGIKDTAMVFARYALSLESRLKALGEERDELQKRVMAQEREYAVLDDRLSKAEAAVLALEERLGEAMEIVKYSDCSCPRAFDYFGPLVHRNKCRKKSFLSRPAPLESRGEELLAKAWDEGWAMRERDIPGKDGIGVGMARPNPYRAALSAQGTDKGVKE